MSKTKYPAEVKLEKLGGIKTKKYKSEIGRRIADDYIGNVRRDLGTHGKSKQKKK